MKLLYEKALEIDSCGLNAVIDAGFWYRQAREDARAFFQKKGIRPQWHYVHVSDENWRLNIASRNQSTLMPGSCDYFVDENILRKFENPLDVPTRDEMDVWYDNNERSTQA